MSVVGVVVGLLLAAVIARAVALASALALGQREVEPVPQGPPLSIVVPLHGWDAHLPATLSTLGRSAPSFQALEILVVVDDDHPRRAELAALPGVQLVTPDLPLDDGDVDKVRRLRCGVARARHTLVMLMDSDVVIDADNGIVAGTGDWLLRRVAPHVHDPDLRLSYALPAYHRARAAGDAVLGSFTLHSNLTVHFLGSHILGAGSSIGPSVVVDNADGALGPLLETLRAAVADDHALGFHFGQRGDRVRALPMTVTVDASDPSLTAATAQVVRWLTAMKTVGPLVTPTTVAWLLLSTLLNQAGPLCFVAFVASSFLKANAFPWLGGGVACVAVEVASLMAGEALAGRRRPRLHALWSVPAFLLLLPLWTALASTKKQLVWRGRVSPLG